MNQSTHSNVAYSTAQGLIHHSDRGVHYLCIRYTDRLADADIANSVGSVGDSYDNALAETINGPLLLNCLELHPVVNTQKAVVAKTQWRMESMTTESTSATVTAIPDIRPSQAAHGASALTLYSCDAHLSPSALTLSGSRRFHGRFRMRQRQAG